MAIPTKNEGTRGKRSRRRGGSAFLHKPLGLAMLSAGRTLGLKCGSRTAAAPDCAKESKVEAALPPLWTLFRGWPSERVRFTQPLPRFTPVFFPLSGKKRRLAGCCVPIPPGRDRHSCVLAVLARFSALAGSLRVCTFLYGDLDGLPECGERGYGVGGAALVRLCAITLAL